MDLANARRNLKMGLVVGALLASNQTKAQIQPVNNIPMTEHSWGTAEISKDYRQFGKHEDIGRIFRERQPTVKTSITERINTIISQNNENTERSPGSDETLSAAEQRAVFVAYMEEMSTMLNEMKIAEGDEIWAGLNIHMGKIKEAWSKHVQEDIQRNVTEGRTKTSNTLNKDPVFRWKIMELIPFWQTSFKELYNTEKLWIKDMNDSNMPGAAVRILEEKKRHIPTIQQYINTEGTKLFDNPNPTEKDKRAFFDRLTKASKFVENTEAKTAPLFNAELKRQDEEDRAAIRRMNANPTWRYLTSYFSVLRTVGPPGFNCRWGRRGDFSCSDGKGIYSRGPQW